MICEIQADARLNYFVFSGRLQVRVEHQVGSLIQPQSHALRFNVRNRPRLPEQQVAIGVEDLRLNPNLHPPKTRTGFALSLARGRRSIDQYIGMMYVTLVSRPNLDRLNPLGFLDGNAKNEIPVGVRSLRWKNEWLFCFQYQVRLSQPPALD